MSPAIVRDRPAVLTSSARTFVRRARFAVRERGGVGGFTREAQRRLRNRLDTDARHVWFELDLVAPRPTRALPHGLTLRTADEADLVRVAELGPTGRSGLERYRARSGTPWVVVEGSQLLFSCWIFRKGMPGVMGRRGWVPGEPGAAFLEESVTAAAARGRGIAPAAWSLLADTLQRDGLRWMRTPIRPDNAAVQAALRKVGFVPVAVSRTRYRRLRLWVEVELLDERGRWLERAVATEGASRRPRLGGRPASPNR